MLGSVDTESGIQTSTKRTHFLQFRGIYATRRDLFEVLELVKGDTSTIDGRG